MKRWLLAASTCALIAAASPAHARKSRTVVDRIVAIVDDTCITQSALDRELLPWKQRYERQYKNEPSKAAEALRTTAKSVLHTMVDGRLLLRAAEDARLTASQSEIDMALASVAQQNHWTVPELLREVEKLGFPEAAYRRRLEEEIKIARLVNFELGKRTKGLDKLSPEARSRRMTTVQNEIANELRVQAHVEERL